MSHYFKPLSAEQFLGIPKPKPAYSIYRETIMYGDKTLGEIDIASRGVTLVLSRDVRASVRRAADAAIAIANREDKRPVFYINTFASAPLVQECVRTAMLDRGISAPVPDPEYADESFWPAFEEQGVSARRNSCRKEHEKQRRERQRDYIYKRTQLERTLAAHKGREVQPNFSVYDIPIGEWISGNLIHELRRLIAAIDEANPKIAIQPPVIILNAFEFAGLTSGERWRIARELLSLVQQYRASVVVFSQAMRQDLKRGMAGRGAIGMLCTMAERVCRIVDPHEALIRKRVNTGAEDGARHAADRLIRSEKANIHEAQTQPQDNEELGMMNDERGEWPAKETTMWLE